MNLGNLRLILFSALAMSLACTSLAADQDNLLHCGHLEYGWDYPGNDIKNVPHAPDANWCMDQCQKTMGCKGFTWNKQNKLCWLKHTAEKRSRHNDGVSGVLCHPLLCDGLQDGYDYPGNDIKNIRMAPHATWCMERCKETLNCKGFTWNKENQNCWLKHTMKGRTSVKVGVSAVLCDPLLCGELQHGYDYPGNDITHKPDVKNAHTCENICQHMSHCRGFTWNLHNKNCWLKHTMKGRTPHVQGVSEVLC